MTSLDAAPDDRVVARSEIVLDPPVNDRGPDRPRTLGRRTVDDTASLVGAGAASIALSWLLYTRVFAWSGKLGLALFTYALFLLLFGIVTAMGNDRPTVVERLTAAVITGGASVVGLALVSTVSFIFVRALPALQHANFYTHDMSGVRPTSPLTQGGVLHAELGSAIEVGIAIAISLPLGIGTAVYMTEVGGRLSTYVRTVVEAMTALPDILAGLFVYTVLIIGFHAERTGLAAALALAVTMVPIIARSAEVVLRLVPAGLREASLALGASQWQTVRRVVLPTAKSGLATALILGIARIAGETAPLLIVSGASTFRNTDPLHNPMNSLPLYIFSAVRSGEPFFIARGYGAAAVLLTIVLLLFTTTRFLARDKGRAR